MACALARHGIRRATTADNSVAACAASWSARNGGAVLGAASVAALGFGYADMVGRARRNSRVVVEGDCTVLPRRGHGFLLGVVSCCEIEYTAHGGAKQRVIAAQPELVQDDKVHETILVETEITRLEQPPHMAQDDEEASTSDLPQAMMSVHTVNQ